MRLAESSGGPSSTRIYEVEGIHSSATLSGTVRRQIDGGWEPVGGTNATLRIGRHLVELEDPLAAAGAPRRWRIVDVRTDPAGAVFDLIEVGHPDRW